MNERRELWRNPFLVLVQNSGQPHVFWVQFPNKNANVLVDSEAVSAELPRATLVEFARFILKLEAE